MRLDHGRVPGRQATFCPGRDNRRVHARPWRIAGCRTRPEAAPQQCVYRLVALVASGHTTLLRRTILVRILARRGKDLSQIQRPGIANHRREALGDLSLIHSFVPQLALDVFADGPARARKMARGCGLVFAERAADLGKRQVLPIVASESEPVARLEAVDSRGQGPSHQLDKPPALGRRGVYGCSHRYTRVLISRKGIEPACPAQPVYESLGEYRP
jgi:hypothetical protein